MHGFQRGPEVKLLVDAGTGAIVDANKAAVGFYGFDRASLCAKKAWDLHVLPQDEVVDAMARAMAGDQTHFAFEQVLASGAVRQVEAYWTPVEVEERSQLYAVIIDTTDRCEMLEALMESERRFRAIADDTCDWESSLGQDGHLLWVNGAVERLTGHSVETCMAMTDYPLPLAHEEDREEVGNLLRQALEEGSAGNDHQFRVTRPGGETVWMGLSWQSVRGDEAKITGIRMSIRDISARYEADRELLTIRAALDDCSEAVVMLDQDHNVTYFNMAFGNLFGYTLDSAGDVDFEALWVEKASIDGVVARAMDGASWEHEGEMISGRGVVFQALARATPVLDDDFSFLGVLFILSDMTKRLQMETELLQAQKLQSVGQLAAGVAHEINTPMQYLGDNARFVRDSVGDLVGIIAKYQTAIEAAKTGALEQAQIEELEAAAADAEVDYLAEEIPQALNQSLEGIGHVAEIVRALREFTHPGTAGKTLADLNKVVENAAVVSRNVWRYAADLDREFAPELPAIPCLPGEMGEVLLNLIVNAALAIEEDPEREKNAKGQITVSTTHDQTHVEVRVRDNGGGIPEAIRERIFDPFFTTRDVGRGTGQGLAISRAVVVEKHGGSLTFETEAGKGTTFIVRLPLGEGSGEAAQASPTQDGIDGVAAT